MTLTLLFYLPVNGLILPLTACKSSMFKLVNDSVYDWNWVDFVNIEDFQALVSGRIRRCTGK
jgi:hypothetical protein